MSHNRVHDKRMEDVILDHLKEVGNISAIEANALYRCRSISRRITTLRNEGWNVLKEMKKDHTGQRYVRYSLKAFNCTPM